MKFTKTVSSTAVGLIIVLMAAISMPAFTQSTGRDRMKNIDREQQVDRDRDRSRDRDRVYDRDYTKDRNRLRDQSMDGKGGKIYGFGLMTQEERNVYRQRIKNAKTKKERNEIREEHRKEMRERAREKGITFSTGN